MEITWLGTAGFEVKTETESFLLDPFLKRNRNAVPVQEKTISDFKTASQIFVSHGHFDHVRDIPELAVQADATVYCSGTVAKCLRNHRVDRKLIRPVFEDKKNFNFQQYTAQAFFSRHIRFDAGLVMATLAKINTGLLKYLPLLLKYRCGRVLSWRFTVEQKTILFFGSAGSSPAELKKMGKAPIDILLVPLQGHSDICRIGLDHVKYLRPGAVIVHHHDNFFPPISKTVDIRPFVDKMKQEYKQTRVIVPKINEALTF